MSFLSARTTSRLALYAFIAILAAISVRDLARLGSDLPWLQMRDFQDFYCAGEAINHRANPYQYEPLHACEHRVSHFPMVTDHPDVVIPAPQPPYDFALFSLLSRLGFGDAKALYAIIVLLTLVLTVLALARAGVPPTLSLAALALPVAYLNLGAGQIVPLAFLFLSCCGAALAAKRDLLAGVSAAMCLIEPHLGLPVVAAVFLFVARARYALVGTLVALFLASIALVGPGVVLQYATQVVPAHAVSEFEFPYQYSATYAARFWDAPAGAARTVGEASYAILLFAGLWLARRSSQTLKTPALLAFVPAAAVTLGGPFIHSTELIFAVPAALTLSIRLAGYWRMAAAGSLCCLMVPWLLVWTQKKLFAASILACLLALLQLQLPAAFIAGAIVCLTATIYGFELHPGAVTIATSPPHPVPPGELASEQWHRFTDRVHTSDPRWFAIKLPSWGALAALLVAAFTSRKR